MSEHEVTYEQLKRNREWGKALDKADAALDTAVKVALARVDNASDTPTLFANHLRDSLEVQGYEVRKR